MFCYYLLGGDTVVPSGLYARLCHAFLVKIVATKCQILRLKCITLISAGAPPQTLRGSLQRSPDIA